MDKQLVGKKVKVIDYSNTGSSISELVGKELFIAFQHGYMYTKNGKQKKYYLVKDDGSIRNLNDIVSTVVINNYYVIAEGDIDFENINKSSIKLNKKREEVLDEYGQTMAIILKDDEKTIYLTQSLRTTLELKEGDYIGFAIDKEQNTILLYKEEEPNQGWIIENGQVITSADWRDIKVMSNVNILYYIGDVSTTLDYPDYVFYPLSAVNRSPLTFNEIPANKLENIEVGNKEATEVLNYYYNCRADLKENQTTVKKRRQSNKEEISNTPVTSTSTEQPNTINKEQLEKTISNIYFSNQSPTSTSTQYLNTSNEFVQRTSRPYTISDSFILYDASTSKVAEKINEKQEEINPEF